MDWQKRLPFLRWAADGESAVLGWDDEGNPGYACLDGSIVRLGDPRLGEYEADRRRRLGESCEETRHALDNVFDTLADLGNAQPFPRDFLRSRPECVAWLIGQNPGYCPTVFELKVLRPAYVERLRRLTERGLAGGGRENGDEPQGGQTPADVRERAEARHGAGGGSDAPASPEHDRATPDGAERGVSLLDVASWFESDDVDAARNEVRRLSNSKRIMATPIGKCPNDARANLYRLSDLLSDVKEIRPLEKSDVAQLRQHLTTRQRRPRPA